MATSAIKEKLDTVRIIAPDEMTIRTNGVRHWPAASPILD